MSAADLIGILTFFAIWNRVGLIQDLSLLQCIDVEKHLAPDDKKMSTGAY
jgi:hypothetical protein